MTLFGTSGIRRIADRTLLEIALRAGLAVGRIKKSVVIAGDTRTSTGAIKHAVISGLLASGARCTDAGMVPTPTLALAASEFEAGIMVTASHNPPEYNGLKMFNPDGSCFDSAQQLEIEKLVSGVLATAPWKEIGGSTSVYEKAVENHIEHILKNLPSIKKTRVVLDCACGAASVITPELLKRMGCEVVPLNCSPSGLFPHDVEPVERNLGDLIKTARESGAIGIAHDGDADRMMAVDEKGRFIPGDKLLVLLAQETGAKKIVTTVDASIAIEETGLSVNRTKVGDTFVSMELRKSGDFGGEPSGAWIFPKNSLCPDGIYAAAVLTAIASRESLASIIDRMPQYPVIRDSQKSNGVVVADLYQNLMSLRPLSVNDTDGLKLGFEDGWLLVRPSGTEPKIRITVEAKTEARAQELYGLAVKAVESTRRNI
jgi:phosphoglucosamine mutase